MHRIHADRVTQQWLRWRIGCCRLCRISLRHRPDTTADRCWSEIAEYLSTLPPEMRGIRSLFLDTQDPEMFYMQCRALEALMHLALNHAKDPER